MEKCSSHSRGVTVYVVEWLKQNYPACSSSSDSGRWDSLPEDLLSLILDKVLSSSVYDYVRCATVSKSWFLSAAQLQHDVRYRRRQLLPWLLFPTGDGRRTYRTLYNIINNTKSCRLNVPYCKRYCGSSSYGWLVFAQEDNTLALTLYNPFTATTIHLPPLLSEINYEIKKVVLSDDPSSNNYEVLSLQSKGRLALFTSRHGMWIYPDNYLDYDLDDYDLDKHDDIIYFKGKFHALIDRNLGSVEIYNNNIDKDKPSYIRLEPLDGVEEIQGIMLLGQSYLVESISGTLLYVQRLSLNPENYSRAFSFTVYELEEEAYDGIVKRFIMWGRNNTRAKREQGEQAFFLGYNHSMSVRASDFPGCRPNTIYFTDDYCVGEAYNYEFSKVGEPSYLSGSYIVGRERLSILHDPSHTLPSPSPIWIVPQPNLTL